jgi:cytochrome c oxidase assembly factor CtaG
VLLTAILLGYAAAYLTRVRTLARRGRPVAAWRCACFLAGLATLGVTITAPVRVAAADRLTAHMIEHLAIGDVAALLLVLGLTRPVAAPLMRVRALRALRAFGHPLVALPLWALTLWLWHIPGAYEAALRHDALHAVQHACFLGAGMALWMPLLGPFPRPVWFGAPAQAIYLLAAWLGGAALANLLLWSDAVFYDVYGGLADQQGAGAVMMVEQTTLVIALLGWICLRGIREAGERQALAELAAARGVALEPPRVARAGAAGRAQELRSPQLAGGPDVR